MVRLKTLDTVDLKSEDRIVSLWTVCISECSLEGQSETEIMTRSQSEIT